MKNVKFDINPHVINQLGAELVSDDITALMELVKNSYDADASYVIIKIMSDNSYIDSYIKYKNQKGYIIVEDDGFGMDENTILKSWLTISYSNKRAINGAKKKTPQGRTPLGDKGLGRLSTQRLADCCEIFTSKDAAKEKLHIAFNWRDFENVDQLSSVPVFFDSIPTNEGKGTKLILTNLHNSNSWKGEKLEKFKAHLSQMISPYSESRPFNVYVNVDGEDYDIVKQYKELMQLSISEFDMKFDGSKLCIKGSIKPSKLMGNNNNRDDYYNYIHPDQGKKFRDYFIEKNKNDQTIIIPDDIKYLLKFKKTINFELDSSKYSFINGRLANPGAFSGKIYDFAYEGDESITNIYNSFSEYKAFTKAQAGIKLYRDGFSVIPYGIDGQDWLKLGSQQTVGSSFYSLRPLNVIGYIAISEGINIHLKDKTDRQGLVDNEYYDNFRKLIDLFIAESNQFIMRIRRAYIIFTKENKQENSGFKTVTQAYEELKETASFSTQIEKNLIEIKNEIKDASKKTNYYLKTKSSSPLFSSVEENEASSILKDINNLLIKAEEILSKVEKILAKSKNLDQIVNFIEPKIATIESQLADFSDLAALGLTAESISHELSQITEHLSGEALVFRKKIEKNISAIDISDSFSLLEYIDSSVNSLRQQLKHIDPALKYARDSKSTINLELFFKEDEYEYYKERFHLLGISFNIDIIDNFNIQINKGKLIQVFDNLFNNSEYWLRARLEKDPSFEPEIKIRIEKPWIYIEDNGYGVSEAIQDSLFEPFITTKPKGHGRGLGLFIILQLLDSIGCSIILEPKLNSFKRKYIFSINFANIINS